MPSDEAMTVGVQARDLRELAAALRIVSEQHGDRLEGILVSPETPDNIANALDRAATALTQRDAPADNEVEQASHRGEIARLVRCAMQEEWTQGSSWEKHGQGRVHERVAEAERVTDAILALSTRPTVPEQPASGYWLAPVELTEAMYLGMLRGGSNPHDVWKEAREAAPPSPTVTEASIMAEALREALKPFAAAVATDDYDDDPDGDYIWEKPVGMEITFGDLRRARQALITADSAGER